MGHGSSSHGEVRDYLKHVNTDIIPAADAKYQLGSTSRQFTYIYASSGIFTNISGGSSAAIGSSLIVQDSMQSAFLIGSDASAGRLIGNSTTLTLDSAGLITAASGLLTVVTASLVNTEIVDVDDLRSGAGTTVFRTNSSSRMDIYQGPDIIGTQPDITMFSTRTSVAAGNRVGSFSFNGVDADSLYARIDAIATQTHVSGTNGLLLNFYAIPNNMSGITTLYLSMSGGNNMFYRPLIVMDSANETNVLTANSSSIEFGVEISGGKLSISQVELDSGNIIQVDSNSTTRVNGGHFEIARNPAPELYIHRSDTSIGAGNGIGSIYFMGDDPTERITGAAINVASTEAWETGSAGSQIAIAGCPNGQSTVLNYLICSDGILQVAATDMRVAGTASGNSAEFAYGKFLTTFTGGIGSFTGNVDMAAALSVGGLLAMQDVQTDTQNAVAGNLWVDTMGFVRMST